MSFFIVFVIIPLSFVYSECDVNQYLDMRTSQCVTNTCNEGYSRYSSTILYDDHACSDWDNYTSPYNGITYSGHNRCIPNDNDRMWCYKYGDEFECSPESCKPNICYCDNGYQNITYLDGVCSQYGAHACSECFIGYHLENNKCEINVCTCNNGEAAYGPDCQTHNTEQCIYCNEDEYFDFEEYTCKQNKCQPGYSNYSISGVTGDMQCKTWNNEETSRTGITLSGHNKCIDDGKGYFWCRFGSDNAELKCSNPTCLPNVCTCEHGEPIVSNKYLICPHYGQETCAMCDDGYYLDIRTKKCLPSTCSPGYSNYSNTTISGKSCLEWNYTSPYDGKKYEGHNFCIDGGKGFQWCFHNESSELCEPSTCMENICECENGIPVATNIDMQQVCPFHGAPICASCNKGYHLEDIECKPNVCTCDGGVAAYGPDCTYHNTEKCVVCDVNEYFDFEEYTCKENMCEPGFSNYSNTFKYSGVRNLCHGWDNYVSPRTNIIFSGHNVCIDDDKGYAWCLFFGYEFPCDTPTCKPNVCTCENGTPVITNEYEVCPRYGDHVCASCNSGYALDIRSKKCVPTTCSPGYTSYSSTTTSGNSCLEWNYTSPYDGKKYEGHNFCIDGGKGFQWCFHNESSESCAPPTCMRNICECDNGTAVATELCPYFGAQRCASCDDTYHLDNGRCKQNICSCDNGSPFLEDGTSVCYQHGDKTCGHCDYGYHLENNQCLPNICTCNNGIAAYGSLCEQHNTEKCVTCNVNEYFDFMDYTCKNNTCPSGYSRYSISGVFYGYPVPCNEWNFVSDRTGISYSGHNLCINDNLGVLWCRSGSNNISVQCFNPMCRPNKCTCENGTPVEGRYRDKTCTNYGQEMCAYCNEGYHLENNMCKPNICTCDGGIAAHGSGCMHHNSTGCVKCDDNEYFDFEDYICKENTCDDGYSKYSNQLNFYGTYYTCNTWNEKSEQTGITYSGHNRCIKDGKTYFWCRSGSNNNWWLCDTPMCKPNICNCENGTPVTDGHVLCTHYGDEQCSHCDAGYHLADGKCILKECTCENGAPAKGEDCAQHNTSHCTSCNYGFIHENGACVEGLCSLAPCHNGICFDNSLESNIDKNSYSCYTQEGAYTSTESCERRTYKCSDPYEDISGGGVNCASRRRLEEVETKISDPFVETEDIEGQFSDSAYFCTNGYAVDSGNIQEACESCFDGYWGDKCEHQSQCIGLDGFALSGWNLSTIVGPNCTCVDGYTGDTCEIYNICVCKGGTPTEQPCHPSGVSCQKCEENHLLWPIQDLQDNGTYIDSIYKECHPPLDVIYREDLYENYTVPLYHLKYTCSCSHGVYAGPTMCANGRPCLSCDDDYILTDGVCVSFEDVNNDDTKIQQIRKTVSPSDARENFRKLVRSRPILNYELKSKDDKRSSLRERRVKILPVDLQDSIKNKLGNRDPYVMVSMSRVSDVPECDLDLQADEVLKHGKKQRSILYPYGIGHWSYMCDGDKWVSKQTETSTGLQTTCISGTGSTVVEGRQTNESSGQMQCGRYVVMIGSMSSGCDDVECCINDVDNDGICDEDDNCVGTIDACGVCEGPGILEGECDCDGNVLDVCGVCNGTGIPHGQCDCSGKVLDECGVCGGPGIPDGQCDCNGNVLDAIGVCGGNCTQDSNNDGNCDDECPQFDECGVCEGPGILEGKCDCDGNVLDECGVCEGPGILEGECDCNGNVLDVCGVCNGTGIPDGQCDCSGNVLDECGVCGGSGILEGKCDCDGNTLDSVGTCGGGCSLDLDENNVCDHNLLVYYSDGSDLSQYTYTICEGDGVIEVVKAPYKNHNIKEVDGGYIGPTNTNNDVFIDVNGELNAAPGQTREFYCTSHPTSRFIIKCPEVDTSTLDPCRPGISAVEYQNNGCCSC